MTIKLVTDEASDLPPSWRERFDIHVVGLHLLEEEDGEVSTSAATPDEFGTVYEAMLADPECTGIVSVHLSSKLSRTWQSAADASHRFGGRVLVVDSQGAGMAFGAAVAQCAWAAEQGLGLSRTYDLAERLCRGATMFASLESLDSLRRGGRIGPAAALFGGVLSMRPVLRLREGEIAVAGKARTTTKALHRMRTLLRDELTRGDTLVVVHHHHAPERAAEVAEDIRKETPYPERVLVVPFDEVMGWHLGDGTVAVSVSDLHSTEFPILPVAPQDEPAPRP